jgi:hypothetical protein
MVLVAIAMRSGPLAAQSDIGPRPIPVSVASEDNPSGGAHAAVKPDWATQPAAPPGLLDRPDAWPWSEVAKFLNAVIGYEPASRTSNSYDSASYDGASYGAAPFRTAAVNAASYDAASSNAAPDEAVPDNGAPYNPAIPNPVPYSPVPYNGPSYDVLSPEAMPLIGSPLDAAAMYGDHPGGGPWHWQLLPAGFVYRAYLAAQESRLGAQWFDLQGFGGRLDATLGGRAGILRYGSDDDFWPEGWQLDIEGAAIPRLDFDDQRDLISSDYRVGVPLGYRQGPWEAKFGYYHLSSHLGDEFIEDNPGVLRDNYSRDALVLGLAMRIRRSVRLYGEAGWAFANDGMSEPWDFQFGAEYSPWWPTGWWGAPFMAANCHLREEVDFSGSLTVQTGWQWRGDVTGSLFRVGLHYYNGKSSQYQFQTTFEQQLGLGLWYDF